MDKKVLIKAITILQESIFEIMDFDDDKNGEDLHKLLELLKLLLKIPKRTIETLKVGDCLDITINDENVTCYLKIDNIETAKEYLNSLKSYEIHQIIPHEFLELWGEINA